MALTVTLTGTPVTLDETAGLQDDDTNSALPTAFSTRLTALGANPATAINAAVSNGNVISVNGVTGTITNLAFTDASGGALDGDTSGLFTNDGEEIFLFTDAVNDNVVLGKTAAGAIAFAVFIEETGSPVSGGKFWSIQFEALEHPNATNPDDRLEQIDNLNVTASESIELNFGFAGAPSGSNLFMTFGAPGTAQIVVIGQDPLNQSQGGNINTKDVLNISQAGGTTSFGVNGNQINTDEGAFITYVTGANTDFLVPNLSQNEADIEANIAFTGVFNATAASFTVNQTNPPSGPVTVKISALSTAAESGVNFVDGLTNDTHVNILTAEVIGNPAAVATVNPDGTVTVTGLNSGDQVRWTTSGTHNRVLIENDSDADGIAGNDNNTFDIGGFSLSSSTANTASAFVGPAVNFDDDGPTAAIAQLAATVAHDETAGVQADADDTTAAAVAALFAGVANVSPDLSPAGFAQDASPVVSSAGSSAGTDAVGATTAFSLAVSAAGVDSGLDTTDGTGVFLFKEGDLVVGRIGGAAGEAAFAVAINGASGVVSMAQYASLKHPTGGASHDESASITDSALLAVVTVTDGDGDTATSSTGIGDAVQFQDDGPTAAIAQLAATVAHDETAGVQADADDTTAAAVAALFAGVANVSPDLSPSGFAQDASPVVSSAGGSAGADEEGATTAFSLAVSAAGVDSGLDTTDGTGVFLFKEGDLVVGRIGGAAGEAAFAVAINGASGVVSMAQYASLKHPTGGASHDESVSITDSVLLAVVTVTDGDGDTAASSTGIGDAVQFQDDGPAIGPIANSVVAFATNATSGPVPHNANFGADEEGGTVKITNFTDVPDLTEALSPDGTTLTYSDADGPLFRLVVNNTNYTFTVLQDPSLTFSGLDFSDIPSGAPVETITVPSSAGVDVVFDGLRFQANNLNPFLGDPNLAADKIDTNGDNNGDDINVSDVGFGIKGLGSDPASNMNQLEGFQATFEEDVSALRFNLNGIGNSDQVWIAFEMYDDGVLVKDSAPQNIALPSGNNEVTVTLQADPGEDFDLILVRFTYADPAESARAEDFAILVQDEVPDQILDFTLTTTDGDLDTASSSFRVGVDGNGGGVIFA